MWFDDALAQRVGQGRVREIANSGAGTVAVACPFCLIMLGDGLAAATPDVQVRDIAELLAEAVLGPKPGRSKCFRPLASDGQPKVALAINKIVVGSGTEVSMVTNEPEPFAASNAVLKITKSA